MESNDLEPGKHVINDGVDLIVIETETAATGSHVFENHQKCIDIHLVVTGSEKITIGNLEKAKVSHVYDEAGDYELFRYLSVAQELQLRPDHFLAIFPGEPHETTVSLNGISEYLKKVVVKVKL